MAMVAITVLLHMAPHSIDFIIGVRILYRVIPIMLELNILLQQTQFFMLSGILQPKWEQLRVHLEKPMDIQLLLMPMEGNVIQIH
jgi:hypothetical protein